MRKPSPEWLLDAAEAGVRDACELLIKARADRFDDCITLLERAQASLEELRKGWQAEPPRRELRGRILGLARDIRRAGALLEQGARLGAAWLTRWQASQRGYTASGSTALVPLETIAYQG
jgi:hypothetical protein